MSPHAGKRLFCAVKLNLSFFLFLRLILVISLARSFDDLTTLLSRKGLMTCDIVIGVDFTSSNEWKGRKTFNSQSLHKTLGTRVYNPYQRVISALAKVLAAMCGMRINAYGFGDAASTNQSVFTFNHQTQHFISFEQVLARFISILFSHFKL
jgi:hypothetical protein